MDDQNWDIGAVVRSCNINTPKNDIAPNLSVKSQKFENDDENFLGRLLSADLTGFDDLVDIFSRDFEVAYQENSFDQSYEIINLTTPVPHIKIMEQNDNQQFLQPILQPTQLSQQIFFPPQTVTLACVPASGAIPQEWIDLQHQLVMQANVNSTFIFPSMRTPLMQTRKRKNQEIKFIYELRQEELADDVWKWHKSGEKPVKSSLFPRNYYKCSTSKDCKAKKQIERSPKGENLFLVAYSGVHNHPLPTKRSSHVGQNACSKSKLPKGINVASRALSLNSSSSSNGSKHSHVVATTENKDFYEEEENVVLISNKFVNEDILKDFEELNSVTSSI